MKPNRTAVPAPTRRPARQGGTTGVKLMLTTAAMTATLGGWAAIAAAAPPAVEAGAPPPLVAPAPAPATLILGLLPLPTLVPPPAAARPGNRLGAATPPPPVVVAPVPVPAPRPTLRVVQPPPAARPAAPVARTRASR